MYVRKRIGRRRSFCQKHGVSIFILACIGIGLFAFALSEVMRKPYTAEALLETQITSDRPELIPNYRPPQNERIVYPLFGYFRRGAQSRRTCRQYYIRSGRRKALCWFCCPTGTYRELGRDAVCACFVSHPQQRLLDGKNRQDSQGRNADNRRTKLCPNPMWKQSLGFAAGTDFTRGTPDRDF